MNFLGINDLRAASGLRIVLVAGAPSPWGQAAKAMMEYKGLDYQAGLLEPGGTNDEIVKWAGVNSGPVHLIIPIALGVMALRFFANTVQDAQGFASGDTSYLQKAEEEEFGGARYEGPDPDASPSDTDVPPPAADARLIRDRLKFHGGKACQPRC